MFRVDSFNPFMYIACDEFIPIALATRPHTYPSGGPGASRSNSVLRLGCQLILFSRGGSL